MMRILGTTLAGATLALTLVACAEDVGEGKVQATVQEAPAEAPAAATPAAGKQLAVDVARSKVNALGAKITAKHPIVFHTWSGKLTVDGDALTGVEIEIDMASLESDAERLTEHLKNEDFFDVAQFPKATFTSSSVTAGSDVEGMTHTVTGDLTIRGKTKRVTFPAKVTTAADTVSAESEFTVNRQDFEIRYPGKPDDLIQDNVVLTISLVAPKV